MERAKRLRSFGSRRLVACGLAGVVLAATGLVTRPAQADPKEDEAQVTICHRSNSDVHPYSRITVDESAVDDVGGADHYGDHKGLVWNPTLKLTQTKWGDIIPPVAGAHSGLNWTTEGRAIYDALCRLPGEPPGCVAAEDEGEEGNEISSTHALVVTLEEPDETDCPPCPLDGELSLDDPLCVPCPYNSQIVATSPACQPPPPPPPPPPACEFDPNLAADSPDCQPPCEFDPDLFADSVECVAPAEVGGVVVTPPVVETPAPAVAGTTLPRTGTDPTGPLGLGLGLILLGISSMVFGRKRAAHR